MIKNYNHHFYRLNVKKRIYILYFFLSFCILGTSFAGTHCFIVSENNEKVFQEGDCSSSYPPCSTFKIAIALMGYDSGILESSEEPVWNFKSEYADWLEVWKQPHNPKLWLKNSCVWYSQVITKKLGVESFNEYVRLLKYGNKDTSGDVDKSNGLTNCWLSSSLLISPNQQIEFLNKLVKGTLPVSVDSMVKTRLIMYQNELSDGWSLYGKTGSGYKLNEKHEKQLDQQIGWYVGFLKKEERVITFVYLVSDSEYHDTFASMRAKSSLLNRVDEIIKN